MIKIKLKWNHSIHVPNVDEKSQVVLYFHGMLPDTSCRGIRFRWYIFHCRFKPDIQIWSLRIVACFHPHTDNTDIEISIQIYWRWKSRWKPRLQGQVVIKLIFWITPSVWKLQHRAKITTFYLLGATHYLFGEGQPPGTTTAKGYYFSSYLYYYY